MHAEGIGCQGFDKNVMNMIATDSSVEVSSESAGPDSAECHE